MKKTITTILFISPLLFLSGCSEKKFDEPGVVDHMTGAEQIKTYKKTKSKIENIDASLEERYQEIE